MKENMNLFEKGARELYCFADSLVQCRALLECGARIIQYRDKYADDSKLRRTAAAMLSEMRHYPDAVLIINDRADIAIETGANGVHFGQDDVDMRKLEGLLRTDWKGLIVGVSVDTPEEARAAEAAGVSYIGAGAVFPTGTKTDAVLIGLEGLRSVTAAVDAPVAAIGGIDAGNIRLVRDAGADYFCVISALNGTPDLPEAFDELRRLIREVL